jgi:mRNA-degrading endonuclease RelE of RelBE toxin-antitoxin system
MIRIVYGSIFLKSLSKLPLNIQKRTAKLLAVLQKNPFDPLLHTKKLSGKLAGFLSFRVTRNYRIVFKFTDSTTIQLIKAADRKDIYR